ncbi:FHIP family protein AAEL005291 isoform X1 [Frieseomelitta varia]|uniref:FHIP family protein AAEL005291 isoform X1 n=1 Tax=Frieseomelitta varia TaxID=561572 RepID=UPI001CB69E14|nr:FHIP family protein AAEL005291 isoform X1 [Frieseomelitta varia]XP_043506579.1 FHIP family protein AAEL005291 isoform X1 [Frieseomelitta varia]
MSWLRSSPLRTSFSKQRSRDSPPKDADPSACYDSFCKHWQQAYEIILRTSPPKGICNQDDVLGVVNHVDQMITLLVLELRDFNFYNNYRQSTTATHSPCLEYLLSENLLVKLYDWNKYSGRYNNAVRLEQLKIYELLVSHSGTLLAHEPVARPLLRLLEDCANDIMPLEVEGKLVVLLNQLCVALMQNMALLDLFFHSTAIGKNKFIIFTLLIPYVHREAGVGQQARDSMLLCMSLSKKNDEVGLYIADHSNICPVLATGLSGLYSLLPRKLDIETDDWHRLTPDDVNDLPALMHLMNSLDFCNAVAQVAHPLVQKQLLEFLYHGFLVPVMGPALLQDSVDLTIEQLDAQEHWTTVDELVAATAYFDLFLRSVTEPGLLRSFVRFLLEDNYDECRILDSLIQRISSRSRLCIVTLGLFETLVNLNCEDIMLELCLGALSPCSHVMLSQRRRLRDIDPFGRAAEKFLSLTPTCCSPFTSINSQFNSLPNNVTYEKYSSVASESLKSLPASINYGVRLSDSLYGNYHAYLCDARQKIRACRIACSNWSYKYNGELPKDSTTSSATTLIDDNMLLDQPQKKKETNKALSLETLKQSALFNESNENSSIDNMLINIQSLLDGKDLNAIEKKVQVEPLAATGIELSLEEQAKLDADIAELLNEDIGISNSLKEMSLIDKKEFDSGIDDSNTTMNSLLSLGESSGYESFAFKGSSQSTPDNEPSEDRISEHDEIEIESNKEQSIFLHSIIESNLITPEELTMNKQSKENYRQDVFNGQPNVGIFLDVLLRKLECMTNNNLYVNLHLTGLISRLAIYPQPLLQSFLLNHSLVFQPSIRSLFQVLASLKHKIDQFLSQHNNVDILVEQARLFLINREDKLVNARKNALEAAAHSAPTKRNSLSGESFSRVFKRCENKKWSLTSSFTQMLKRSSGSSGSSSLINTINQSTGMSENQLEAIGHGSGYRYYTKMSWESPNEVSPIQNVVLCAVVLDEWLKELAAITQEHAIISLTNNLEFKV